MNSIVQRHKSSRVLLLGALGDIGRSIQSIVSRAYPNLEIIKADTQMMESAAELRFRLPPASSADYVDQVLGLISRHGATTIIPTSEAEIDRLSEFHFSQDLRFNVILESRQDILLFGDKMRTFEWCCANNIGTPRTWLLQSDIDWDRPLLIKPRRGSGSKGQVILKPGGKLDPYLEQHQSDYVVQPLEPASREFTCVVSKYAEERVLLVLERTLEGGRSRWVRVSDNSNAIAFAERIAQVLQPKFSINFQFLQSADQFMVFDVNPRFSSTVAMRDAIGFTDLRWGLERIWGLTSSNYTPPLRGTTVEWADAHGQVLKVSHPPDGCGNSEHNFNTTASCSCKKVRKSTDLAGG